jgi:hypothetical protein
MGYFKKLAVELRSRSEAEPLRGKTLIEVAKAVGGDVDGQFVCFTMPDGTYCAFKVMSNGEPYIYECDGSRSKADKYLREILGIEPDPEAEDRKARWMRDILKGCVAPHDTLVETYLKSRGILLDMKVFADVPLLFNPAVFRPGFSGTFPAMVARRTYPDGSQGGLIITYLARDGSGKADGDARIDLGPKGGSAIRLSPVSETLYVGEGIETVMSVMQMIAVPAWACGSAWDLHRVIMPPEVKHVVILRDNDAPGKFCASHAANRFLLEKRKVTIQPPTNEYNDFNDVLMNKKREVKANG